MTETDRSETDGRRSDEPSKPRGEGAGEKGANQFEQNLLQSWPVHPRWSRPSVTPVSIDCRLGKLTVVASEEIEDGEFEMGEDVGVRCRVDPCPDLGQCAAEKLEHGGFSIGLLGGASDIQRAVEGLRIGEGRSDAAVTTHRHGRRFTRNSSLIIDCDLVGSRCTQSLPSFERWESLELNCGGTPSRDLAQTLEPTSTKPVPIAMAGQDPSPRL